MIHNLFYVKENPFCMLLSLSITTHFETHQMPKCLYDLSMRMSEVVASGSRHVEWQVPSLPLAAADAILLACLVAHCLWDTHLLPFFPLNIFRMSATCSPSVPPPNGGTGKKRAGHVGEGEQHRQEGTRKKRKARKSCFKGRMVKKEGRKEGGMEVNWL